MIKSIKINLLFESIFLFFLIQVGNTEIMNFVPIDSIQSDNTHHIMAKDITGDDLDELFICNDDGKFIYNGYDRGLFWADTSHADTTFWTEVGDIEPDGQWDLFAGATENGNHHLYIYPSMNTDARFEWPGYLVNVPVHLYFYFEESIPYLNLLSGGGIKLNLSDWTYEYSYVLGSAIGYYDEKLYTMRHIPEPYDSYRYQMIKYSLNYVAEDSATVAYMMFPYQTSFTYSMGDFSSNQGIEIYNHCDSYEYPDTAHLTLALLNDQFDVLASSVHDSVLAPRKFVSADVIDDSRDELLICATIRGDSLESRNLLINEIGDIIGVSQFEAIQSFKYGCNIDNDNFNELIAMSDELFKIYDVEFGFVDIEEDTVREHPGQYTCNDPDDKTLMPAFINNAIYPNPFNRSAAIKINVIKPGHLEMNIYDIMGRKVITLFSGQVSEGSRYFYWNPDDFQCDTGIYFLAVQSGSTSRTERLVYIK